MSRLGGASVVNFSTVGEGGEGAYVYVEEECLIDLAVGCEVIFRGAFLGEE